VHVALSKESWGKPAADCWLHFMLDCKARIGSLVGDSSYTKRDGGGERACQAGCPCDQTDPGGCSSLESVHPKVSPCVQSIAIWSVKVDAFSARPQRGRQQALEFGCRTASAATQDLPPSPGTLPARSDQAEADAGQQQASSLLNYAWKHVFELPGLPIPLR